MGKAKKYSKERIDGKESAKRRRPAGKVVTGF